MEKTITLKNSEDTRRYTAKMKYWESTKEIQEWFEKNGETRLPSNIAKNKKRKNG